MKIKISNARVIDPASATDDLLDLYLGAGKVLAVGTEPFGFTPNRVIDALQKGGII